MKEPNGILSYEMYEDLKEAVVKALKSDVTACRNGDGSKLTERIEEVGGAVNEATAQIAALNNRIGRIDFQPVIKVHPPDISGVNEVFQHINSRQDEFRSELHRIEEKIDHLQTQVSRIGTEVDTRQFEQLSNHTLYEMKQQIRYLKQPPIVLKIIIGITIVALLATLAAGYYIRDSRKWKDSSQYWYEQSQQKTQPKTNKKAK